MSYGIIPPAWNLERIYGSISLKPAIASSLSVCFQPDSHIAYFHSSHSTLGKTYHIKLFLSSESFRSYLEKRSNSLQLPIRPYDMASYLPCCIHLFLLTVSLTPLWPNWLLAVLCVCQPQIHWSFSQEHSEHA